MCYPTIDDLLPIFVMVYTPLCVNLIKVDNQLIELLKHSNHDLHDSDSHY